MEVVSSLIGVRLHTSTLSKYYQVGALPTGPLFNIWPSTHEFNAKLKMWVKPTPFFLLISVYVLNVPLKVGWVWLFGLELATELLNN